MQAAVSWLEKYPGKKVVRGYARWFGVDLICAARELQMLGVALDPGYIERLHASARARCTRRAKLTQEEPLDDLIESDDDFSFIAGYTSAGIPYRGKIPAVLSRTSSTRHLWAVSFAGDSKEKAD